MIKKIAMAAIGALLVMQAGLSLADTTETRVFTVNKTAGNVFLVVTDDDDSTYQEVASIPSKSAGHVTAQPKAWFRNPTTHHYTARLFYEGVEGAFCTVKFSLTNNYEKYPVVTAINVNSAEGVCKAAGFIEEHKRNTACQVVIKSLDSAATAR